MARAHQVSGLRGMRILLGLLLCIALCGMSVAQKAESLTQIKKIYVESLGEGRAADEMRARVEDRLRASRKFQVLASAAEADAIVKGTGRIWTTGYVSLSVHPSRGNREPVFDGFLSVSIEGKDDSTLWSYLFTPSKFSVKRITTDLADQFVPKFVSAVEQETQDTRDPSVKRNVVAVSLRGAGSTLAWPLYQKWLESYEQRVPNVRISYDPVGSESGIRLLAEGEIDFAGSDMPLSDEAMSQSKVKFRHFASVLGAVVPIYNLRNLTPLLNFSPATLAGIYLGTIKRWNDPILKASNPGVSLPDSEIVVVHRSDGSGTTFAWADYLTKVSPEWKEHIGAPGTTISWPVGQGAERNEGVAALVRQTPNSIGYVELIYAIQHELRFGAVQNAEGNYVKADVASVTAAAAGFSDNVRSDFRVSITNAPGKNAYPIATFTWLLLPTENGPASKREALIEFLRWALTSGQKECSGLGYAPLPSAVASQELQALGALK
jgi:phosphate transport system substrate-binding protein